MQIIPKVCFVSHIYLPLIWHMGPHIKNISKNCDVSLVAKDLFLIDDDFFSINVSKKNIDINRRFSPIADIKSLISLLIFFKNQRFKCVHSITPKGGFIGMLAAVLLGVEFRIHTFTGQMWICKNGVTRFFYIFIDRMIVKFATHIIADSHSQRKFLIDNKIVKPEKIVVFGNGSIVGVDTKRFINNDKVKEDIRRTLGIEMQGVVFLYIGRLNKEKGISELLSAFTITLDKCLDMHLLIVGPDEENFDPKINLLAEMYPKQVHRVNLTRTPENYMAASDVLVLPSYREGFGNVVIEAASVGLPAIISNVYGLSDSISEGDSGFLHKVGAVHEIIYFVNLLYYDHNLRSKMSIAAKNWATKYFSQEILTFEFEQFYKKIKVF